MTKELIIIGAGGDGRGVAEMVQDIGGEWNLLGYLDDDPTKQGTEINDVPVLGKIADVAEYDNCYFVTILGSSRNYFTRKRVVTRLGIGLQNYATLIHPDAKVSRYADIGRDTVILPGVVIKPNCKIGNHVVILSHVNIDHDTQIADYVTIVNSAAIAGSVTMHEGCYIGGNSSIREQITVGEWSLIGMGSVVVSDVPAFRVVAGNPARILRKLDPAEFQL